MIPKGIWLNVICVIIGSLFGILFNNGLPQELIELSFHLMGLCVFALGVRSIAALVGENFVVIMAAIIFGAWFAYRIRGMIPDIEMLPYGLSGAWEAFILFCLGSLTILASIEEALEEKRTLIYTKSIMDGISAFFLSLSFGYAILFSVVPLLIYQTSLYYLASSLRQIFNPPSLAFFDQLGGFVLLAIGLSMLELLPFETSLLIPCIPLGIVLYKLKKKFIKN